MCMCRRQFDDDWRHVEKDGSDLKGNEVDDGMHSFRSFRSVDSESEERAGRWFICG